MKKLLGVLVGVALVSLTFISPVQAKSYTIHGSAALFDSADVFLIRGCDPALAKPAAQGGLSGIDSAIVPVNVNAPMPLTLSWSAAGTIPGGAVNLSAKFVNAACRQVTVTSPTSATQNKPWSFTVPAGTRYIFIVAHYTVEATVNGLP